MPVRRISSPIAASESVVCRMLSKFLRAAPAETVEDVCLNYRDSAPPGNDEFELMISRVRGLYHWTTDVAAEIMSEKTSPLVEHLMSLPGTVFLVKDSVRPAEDSLWIAVADADEVLWRCIRKMECRGLFHSFRVGHAISCVVAIQLSSCRP